MVLNELNIRAEKFCIFKISLHIVLSQFFQILIVLCILCNTVILCLDRYPVDHSQELVFEQMNMGFFGIFFLEMVLKLLGKHFCDKREYRSGNATLLQGEIQLV